MSDEPRRRDSRITLGSAEFRIEVGMVTLWRSATFAPRWLEDATREAAVDGVDARRREVLFAVCFAESYLLEWVRDEVLKRKFAALDEYFPLDDRRGVIERWRDVPKLLLAKGLIQAHPDYGQRLWSDFVKLVDYRNGLVHARASRPQADHTPPAEIPTPTPQDLHKMPRGQPTRVVLALVRELHARVGAEPPKWFTDPQ
jgi:hypothetical protein